MEQPFFESLRSVFQGTYPKVELFQCIVFLFLIFGPVTILFSIAAALFYIPMNNE